MRIATNFYCMPFAVWVPPWGKFGSVLICLCLLVLIGFCFNHTPLRNWKRVINNFWVSGTVNFVRWPVNWPRSHPNFGVVGRFAGICTAIDNADGKPDTTNLCDLDKWNHYVFGQFRPRFWSVREQHSSHTFSIAAAKTTRRLHHCIQGWRSSNLVGHSPQESCLDVKSGSNTKVFDGNFYVEGDLSSCLYRIGRISQEYWRSFESNLSAPDPWTVLRFPLRFSEIVASPHLFQLAIHSPSLLHHLTPHKRRYHSVCGDCIERSPSSILYGFLSGMIAFILGSRVSHRLLVIGDERPYFKWLGRFSTCHVLIPFFLLCLAYGFGVFVETVLYFASPCEDSEESHVRNNVPQKHLTSAHCCNTVIGMANVLPIDKQIAVIGALAEGSSIRSIERITGIHRDTIMR